MKTKLSGRWGETEASKYLKKKKYKIIGMGYNTRFGEIDIIAENREYIVFVEVKMRKKADFALPREYVDYKKQRRIIASAQMWLAANDCDKQPRFDVIEIYAPEGAGDGKTVIEHLENAFGENF